jgi:hypothetical protein
MTKTQIEYRTISLVYWDIWSIGIYLEFGIWLLELMLLHIISIFFGIEANSAES